MTKFLTVLTLAILALLLMAFVFFLVLDKSVPGPTAVSSAGDPAYEAVIAPPESLVSAPPRRGDAVSRSERQAVAISSVDDEIVQSVNDEGQSTVDESQALEGGADGAKLPLLSADPGAGEEWVGDAAQEVTPAVVELPPEATVSPGASIVSDSGDRASESGGVSADSVSERAAPSGAGRAADHDMAAPETAGTDRAVIDVGEARQSSAQPSRTYTVRRGDTLSSIAKQYYENPALWKRIRDANQEALGKGVRQIPIGTQLTIPPSQSQ